MIRYQDLGSFNEKQLRKIYKKNGSGYLIEYLIEKLPNIDELIILKYVNSKLQLSDNLYKKLYAKYYNPIFHNPKMVLISKRG